MKIFYSFFFLIFISCGYPDIDTVPGFKSLKITEQNSIDLCNISNSDNNSIDFNKCINLENKYEVLQRL